MFTKFFAPLLFFAFCAPIAQAADNQIQDPCIRARLEGAASTALSTDYMSDSHASRVSAMCGLAEALKAQYSLYDMKAERITNPDGSAFNSTEHMQNCIATEDAIFSDDSDLHFLDRVNQCIAGFQDTHLGVMEPVPIPYISAGFTISEIAGHYYIATLNPETMDYLNKSSGGAEFLQKSMVVGNEVVQIDGQSPATLAQQYATYIGGSTSDFTKWLATRSIFFRNFAYPTKGVVELKVKDAKGDVQHFTLPWWGAVGTRLGLNTHGRPDATAYFKKLGITMTDRLTIPNATNEKPNWSIEPLKSVGYKDDDPLFNDNYNPLIEYKVDKSDNIGLRVGQIASPAGAFCYMELLTFSVDKFTRDNKSADFKDVIRDFLSDCKEQKLNLVLDLRENPGGRANLPSQLMQLLAAPGQTLQSDVGAYRVTPDTGRMLTSDDVEAEVPLENLSEMAQNPLDFFNKALAAGESATDIIPQSPNKADEKLGGYPGKILALVTPLCVSACDMTSALLKKSGRAVLLGSHSNGTGAGFGGTKTYSANFTNISQQFTAEIPNFLFGVPDHVLDPEVGVPYRPNKDTMLLENKPTVADIQYTLTHDDLDLKAPGKGWRTAVYKAIENGFPTPAGQPVTQPTPALDVATSLMP